MQLVGRILNQLGTFENGDVAPTAAMLAAYQSACNDLAKAVTAWLSTNSDPQLHSGEAASEKCLAAATFVR